MNKAKTKTGNLGRPAGRDSEKVRQDLLQAARQHFLIRDFKAVSLRQVAETAGVNGAMVNYYFGGKQGLYLAMVDELFEALDRSLQVVANNSELTIADFSRGYSRILADNPWWPNFLVREVLFSEGETRAAIIERFNSSFAPMLLQSIKQEIDEGNYREDLNPQLALLSLMSMTIFPFLARPLVEQVLGLSLEKQDVETLTAHTTRVFLDGVAAPAGAQAAQNLDTEVGNHEA